MCAPPRSANGTSCVTIETASLTCQQTNITLMCLPIKWFHSLEHHQDVLLIKIFYRFTGVGLIVMSLNANVESVVVESKEDVLYPPVLNPAYCYDIPKICVTIDYRFKQTNNSKLTILAPLY